MNKQHKTDFDRLYLAHWEQLYAIARSGLGDADTAKDIVQDVFVNYWERRDKITIRTTVGQYLTGALKNQLIEYFQSQQVKKRVFEHVYRNFNQLVADTDHLVLYKDLEQLVHGELEKMPENMRRSFMLRLNDLSIKEIADRLNLAEQTVNNVLTQASKRLRKNLNHVPRSQHSWIVMACLQAMHDLLTQL